MKKYLLFLLLLLTFSACKKDRLDGEEMEYLLNFELSAGISPLQRHTYTISNETSKLKALLNIHGATMEQVESIKAKLVTADLINPATESYNYLDHIYIEVSTGTEEPLEAGYREFIENNIGNRVDLFPNITEFKDYFMEDEVNFHLSVRPKVAPAFTSTNRLRLVFDVQINGI